jgi:hypothetical protein
MLLCYCQGTAAAAFIDHNAGEGLPHGSPLSAADYYELIMNWEGLLCTRVPFLLLRRTVDNAYFVGFCWA